MKKQTIRDYLRVIASGKAAYKVRDDGLNVTNSSSTSRLLKKSKNKSTNYRLMVDLVCFYQTVSKGRYSKHVYFAAGKHP